VLARPKKMTEAARHGHEAKHNYGILPERLIKFHPERHIKFNNDFQKDSVVRPDIILP
jgi:hypothetical protein